MVAENAIFLIENDPFSMDISLPDQSYLQTSNNPQLPPKPHPFQTHPTHIT
jgi:hypothetical protein